MADEVAMPEKKMRKKKKMPNFPARCKMRYKRESNEIFFLKTQSWKSNNIPHSRMPYTECPMRYIKRSKKDLTLSKNMSSLKKKLPTIKFCRKKKRIRTQSNLQPRTTIGEEG
jgi:hypothetical protein